MCLLTQVFSERYQNCDLVKMCGVMLKKEKNKPVFFTVFVEMLGELIQAIKADGN